MAKSGATWSSKLSDFGESVQAQVYFLTRDVALKIFENAVKLSPVDTGAYRASWNISEGSPEFVFAGRMIKGTVLPAPNPPKLSTKFYRTFYVTNGAPYAMMLENGYSAQAPMGVLRQAINSI